MDYELVTDFWFNETEQVNWFKKSNEFDSKINTRFSNLFNEVIKGEHYKWREKAEGSLAEILVLDQFSRNMFRDSAEAFKHDSMALTLAQFAISKGFDEQLEPLQRSFMYMPFMHSESNIIHELAVGLFEKLGNKANLEFEAKHFDIIKIFGRYPHRNKILGRESTEDEIQFLKLDGSSF